MSDTMPSAPALTELDMLMAKDPFSLTQEDITDLIAYQRRMRARKTTEATAPKVAPDLSVLLGKVIKPAAPAPTIRRRI